MSEAKHKPLLNHRSLVKPYGLPLNLPVSTDVTGNLFCLTHITAFLVPRLFSLLSNHVRCCLADSDRREAVDVIEAERKQRGSVMNVDGEKSSGSLSPPYSS